MRATLAVTLAMGSPLAGGTLQMAGWRLFGFPFRIVLNILGLLLLSGSALSRQRLRPAKVLKLNVVDDVSGEHDET